MSTETPAVVFLGHMSTAEAYREGLGALRGADLPPPRLEDVVRVVQRMSPMPVCSVRAHSGTGAEMYGIYVDAFLLIDGLVDIRSNFRKVHRACAIAAKSGARLGVLGGFTSIVGERSGVDLQAEFGIPFTTGNTLTAAVLAAQARSLAEPGSEIVVVGAAGDVGSGLCRLLHADGYRLVLVGRRPEPIAALARELAGARPATWSEAAPRADVAVLVASTTLGAIPVATLRPDAWVLDAGHPGNAASGHPRVVRAARTRFERPVESAIPEFTSSGCASGEQHACLAEGCVLGLEGRFEAFSAGRGRITPDRAYEILELAARHGITPAPVAP